MSQATAAPSRLGLACRVGLSESGSRRSRWWVGLLAPLWAASILAGMYVLLDFSATPGDPGAPPATWPVGTRLRRTSGLPTLVMFAHPRCSCTRASLGELARIVARLPGRLSVHVLMLQPAGARPGWWATDIADLARAIPGARVIVDRDGTEARLFRAATSGHTLLYDAAGRLTFSGGITGSRGHAGDNAGESAIVTRVESPHAPPASSLVFGCALAHDDGE